MCNHATKNCPRCNKSFECRADDITQCQCFGITIKPSLEMFLEQCYDDCLCRDCVQFLQHGQTLFKDKRSGYDAG